jgi:hypothetical protein
MKKLIITLFILIGIGFVYNSYSQTPSKEYTFASGDTTTTFSVNKAKVVYFTFRDSSMTGTDTMHITIEQEHSTTGLKLNSIISLYDLSQITTTTRIASSSVIPVDNTTKTFAWYPGGVSGSEVRFTGTFRILRTNESTDDLYLPKTRCIFRFED